MDEVSTNALFLVLAGLVHETEKRIDTEFHGGVEVAFVCDFQEVELAIQLGLEVDLAKVLVQEFEEDQDTVGIDQ